MSKALLDMGCFEISLGDTLGIGTPEDIRRLLTVLLNEIRSQKLAGHFHDTFGQATANVIAAYQMGLRTFDSSVSGLGGCPYSPGAKGNVATEDIVYAFSRMGVDTGVDLAKLTRIGAWISTQLGIPNGSRAGAALLAREKQQSALKNPQPSELETFDRWELQQDAGEYLVHRLGANVRITMNRPKNGNALTPGMLASLITLIKQLSTDQTCFRILLTAAGKYFCTGMDLRNATPESRKGTFIQLRDLFNAIEAAPQTSIAIINGPAFGGGVGLAFACDIRIASDKTTFQLTEVRLGLCPAVISKFIFREWGISFAREAMLSARPVSAKELLAKTGAVHLLVPSDEQGAEKAVHSYLQDLKACAPSASTHVKTLALAAWELQGKPEQSAVIEKAFDDMMLSQESRLGTAAFAKGIKRTNWEEALKGNKLSKL